MTLDFLRESCIFNFMMELTTFKNIPLTVIINECKGNNDSI